jgi:hypothetical protein
MKKIRFLLLAGIIGYLASTSYSKYLAQIDSASLGIATAEIPVTVEPRKDEWQDALQLAFANRQSNVQVQSSGTVDRLLPDDDNGSRHQRFIVRRPSGQTVLIAHNIDLAPRVPLKTGDAVEFNGEYEWNSPGGVVHWTHHDPQGRHVSGWISHEGHKYQ